MNESAKWLASDGALDDEFGVSVAVSAETAVVGAYYDDDKGNRSGSAYVFVLGGDGKWSQKAKLIASDGAPDDTFGCSVAISGDTVVVGASYDDSARGSAYVFVKPAAGWAGTLTQSAKLLASDGVPADFFGFSVAVSEDTVVVGAFNHASRVGDAVGKAYVFVKPGAGWAGTLNETAALHASDGAVNDKFGGSVSIFGDTAVVGAAGDDSLRGSAYVFVKPGVGWGGMLIDNAKLLASDGAAGDRLGAWGVAIFADTAVVGAVGDDTLRGSAYVFVKPGAGWTGTLNEDCKLLASDGVKQDMFGTSVAVFAERALVGAPGPEWKAGSAYVFVKPGGGWTGTLNEVAKLLPSDTSVADFFGGTVAVSAGTAFVGAQGNDNSGGENAGAVYVFDVAALAPPGPGGTVHLKRRGRRHRN